MVRDQVVKKARDHMLDKNQHGEGLFFDRGIWTFVRGFLLTSQYVAYAAGVVILALYGEREPILFPIIALACVGFALLVGRITKND